MKANSRQTQCKSENSGWTAGQRRKFLTIFQLFLSQGVLSNISSITDLGGFDPVWLFLVVGGVMFILGFAGCIGALRENSFLLKFVRLPYPTFQQIGPIYSSRDPVVVPVALVACWEQCWCFLQFSVFLGIIFFLELTAGVLAFVFKDWIKDQLNFFINNNIRAYRDDIDLQNLIDFTQEYVSMCFLKCAVPNPPRCWLYMGSITSVFSSVSAFTLKWECCGAFGADDWNLNIYFNCTDSNPSREKCGVPFSCCTKDPAVCLNTNSLAIVSLYSVRMLRFCISCIQSLESSWAGSFFFGTFESVFGRRGSGKGPPCDR